MNQDVGCGMCLKMFFCMFVCVFKMMNPDFFFSTHIYYLWKKNHCTCMFCSGVSGVGSDEVPVMEGDSVTLNTGVQTNQQEYIKWYFNNIRIAQITGDLSKACTDVQCNEGTERFRDRLKLDHQTGSLTITNITNTHSGEYTLMIISSSSNSKKIFSVSVTGECFNAVYMFNKHVNTRSSSICWCVFQVFLLLNYMK